MRRLIDLIERAELDEASVSRVVRHIREGAVFIAISAMRDTLNRQENERRTDKLRHILDGLPVTYIPTEGEYHEMGAEKPSQEKSFFVLAYNQTGKISAEQLQSIGTKLMHQFDQDSIIFGDGEHIFGISNDGSVDQIGDNATFDPKLIAELPGFTKIMGRKFSYTKKEAPKRPRYAEEPYDRSNRTIAVA